MVRWRVGAVAVVAPLVLVSCGDPRPETCTLVGGRSGVSMSLAPDLYREGREVEVELCQDDRCDTATAGVHRDEGSAYASVSYSRFASTFRPGPARLTATLRDGPRVARVVETEVDLSFSYPNGRACDGDQFLSGRVVLA